ncbi:hypothetical protein [Dickeya poaceiphila]|uniref:Uncharacterized protein n=1 Tax=Dickeya poaceiphila TaxID=568768 RepID=A0A5B8HUU7_9GAMM|nr:hypothetical protein [Dickeya poaceiphila]QDX31936.1 hypothetical protein Dpoa569_0001319 [Dickeya poaceiphila]
MSITSCSTTGHAPAPVVVDTSCNWVKPIYLTVNDVKVLDTQTKKDILAHNRSWQANCEGKSK